MTVNKSWGGVTAIVLLSGSQLSLAGATDPIGPVVSWAPVASTPVPTLGTWALLMLSILLAVIALRTWREAPTVLRSMLLVAAAGLSGGSLLWSEDATSGRVDLLTGASCEGSVDVPEVGTWLENNCGETVVLTVGSCASGETLDDLEGAKTGDLLKNGENTALPHCLPDKSGGM